MLAGSVSVAGSYTDIAGNAAAAGSDTVTIDRINPTVTVNIVDTLLNDADTSSLVTFTFSEATTNFAIGDIVASAGLSLSSFSGSGTSYPGDRHGGRRPTQGTGTVSVTAGSYTDAAGNAGAIRLRHGPRSTG